MGAFLATTAPQLGNPANHQVNEATMDQKFSASELERRRLASRRLGWLLGVAALALYIIGLFVKR